MSSLIRHNRSYLFFFIAVLGILPLAACGGNHPANTTTSKKADDTTEPLANSKKKIELDTTGYKVFQSIKPQMSAGSKQITVYLLEDARLEGLTTEIHYYAALHAAQMKFTSDENISNPDTGYRPAILLTKDNSGAIISYRILDVPCARIDTVYLDENKRNVLYLFTRDYSIGWGSYNGPASYFVYFTDTGMANYKGDNEFATTMKSAWAIRYNGNHMEVWSKLCRPGDNNDFTVTTKKSYFNADSFKSATTVKKGYWEDEGDTGAESLKEFIDNF